jgi:hypothetical protein
MAKSSKKRKRKAERKEIRKAWDVARVEESSKLPQRVALPEHLHSSNYQINFEQYKHKECQIHLLNESSAESLIKRVSLIAQNNSRTIGSSKLIRDNVANDGAYKSLYEGLGKDIEIKEIQFAGTGRIFCHFVNNQPDSDDTSRSSNYCCIIAIKTEHLETK